jgi:hypothetical protein
MIKVTWTIKNAKWDWFMFDISNSGANTITPPQFGAGLWPDPNHHWSFLTPGEQIGPQTLYINSSTSAIQPNQSYSMEFTVVWQLWQVKSQYQSNPPRNWASSDLFEVASGNWDPTITVSTTPEPGTLLMEGMGVIALLGWCAKNRSQKGSAAGTG